MNHKSIEAMTFDTCLRRSVREGIDQTERGEGIEFASRDDLADHIRATGEEVSRKLGAGSVRG
jgi:hypothetical protein